jgi:AcrR family transcriptional regulator
MPRALSKIEVEDFRDRLCEAASRIFAEKGLAGFNMRELAAALGVSPMTPYRYFKDKEEILAAVRARAFDSFSDAMEQAFDAARDPVAKANAAGEAYIRFAFDHPESYRMMFEISQGDDGRYADLERATERARATMTRHIHGLVDRGLLKGDPALLGHVFWAALHGMVMLKLAGKLTQEYSFEKIRDEMFRALTLGLSPRGGAAP